MIRVYIAAAFVAFFCFSFLAGWRMGRDNCVIKNAANSAQINSEIISKGNKVNEKILKTTTDDIRRILRTGYSIAE